MKTLVFVVLPPFFGLGLFLTLGGAVASGMGDIFLLFLVISFSYAFALFFSLPMYLFLKKKKLTSLPWFLFGGGVSTVFPYLLPNLFDLSLFHKTSDSPMLINGHINLDSLSGFLLSCLVFFSFGVFGGYILWLIESRKAINKLSL